MGTASAAARGPGAWTSGASPVHTGLESVGVSGSVSVKLR
jgi:hypothetical protein